MNQPTLPGTSHVSHSNLGKEFEDLLERTHHLYKIRRLASVEKNPVEWRYIGLSEYNKLKNTSGDIVALTNNNRYIKKCKSDVDFCGVAAGRFVTFDAKQTQGKSFPLGNLAEHQLRTLLEKEKCGAISGIMLFFSELNRCFFVSASVLEKAVFEMQYKGGRKSLSLDACEKEGREIKLSNNLADWLKVLAEEK